MACSGAGACGSLTPLLRAPPPLADGFVINNRVLGYLAVARALGDSAFKPGPGQPALVSTHPDVTEAPLDDRDEFLVVACDGLFDVMSNEEVSGSTQPTARVSGLPGALPACMHARC